MLILQAGVTQNNKPNFGMALYLNSNKITKTMGEETASKIKKIFPLLDSLTQDVDVFIDSTEARYLDVKVQKLTLPVIKSKYPLFDFFKKIKKQIQFISKGFIREKIVLGDNIELKLVKEINYLKSLLKK